MGINQDFINELASKAPTPGGGGASAYCGALATALASMVGNLTVGKKTYAAVEDEVKEALIQLEEQRNKFVELIDKDAQAFEPLSRAYRLPRATSEELAHKNKVMQQALVGATEVPLEIMEICAQVITTSKFLAHNGSRLALSDVGVAVLFAKAALKGASLNVYANASSMANEAQARSYIQQADCLIEEYGNRSPSLMEWRFILCRELKK